MEKIIFQSLRSEKRQRVVQSHLKYKNKFIKTASKEEFDNLIQHFICEHKSRAYCNSVIETIIGSLKRENPNFKRPISKEYSYKIYKRAKKFQDLNIDKKMIYYNQDNVPYEINKFNVNVNMGVTTHINEAEAQELLKYSLDVLQKFLKKSTAIYTITIEWSMIIQLLAYTGCRISEILSLDLKAYKQITNDGYTTITTKNGEGKMFVNKHVVELLQQFIKHPSQPAAHDNKTLFRYKYFELRRENIKQYRTLFNKKKPYGLLFHVWRSYFTSKAFTISQYGTQKLLNQNSQKMTQRYLKNQIYNDIDGKKDLINKVEEKIKNPQ